MQNLLSTARFPVGRAVQCHSAKVSIPPNPTSTVPSAGRRKSYTFTDRIEGQPCIYPQKSWETGDNATKPDCFFCICLHILHCWLERPAESFCREERMKMNTDSNLHFKIAEPGCTAFKLWKEPIALRDENYVVAIFAVVLLSHSRVGRRICVCALGCLSDNARLFSCNWSTGMCYFPPSLPWKHSIWQKEKMDKWGNILNHLSGSVWASLSMLYVVSTGWID